MQRPSIGESVNEQVHARSHGVALLRLRDVCALEIPLQACTLLLRLRIACLGSLVLSRLGMRNACLQQQPALESNAACLYPTASCYAIGPHHMHALGVGKALEERDRAG
jgi:hypothetical protein